MVKLNDWLACPSSRVARKILAVRSLVSSNRNSYVRFAGIPNCSLTIADIGIKANLEKVWLTPPRNAPAISSSIKEVRKRTKSLPSSHQLVPGSLR